MTEEHWKLARMSTLLRYSFTFLLLLQLEGCHGQAGSSDGGANFFYYYSPTQRTMVNHGAASGNIFNNPFLQQQQQQVQAQPTLPPFRQQTALPNLQYTSPATSLLGYQQTHSAPGSIFTTQQPLGQLPFQQFGQLQNLVQPTAAFSGFTGFGQNLFANNAAYLQPGAPTLAPQQQQQQQNQAGGLSFYESPFQFLQNRYLQTPPTPSIPAPAPEQPLPATTVAPTLEPVATPTTAPRRKQKNSSRLRYVQQPQQIQYQFNPYTRLVTPITSALPYTEQRYYSSVIPSVPSPTGYSFSLGGGTQSTSSVHVSMGPLTNNIQQHLTEITNIRRVAGKRRKPVVYNDQLAVEHVVQDPVVGAGSMMMSHDAPMMEPTSEQSSIAPELPSPTPMTMNMTSTMDTLLNEPSFQLETIAAPAAPLSTAAPIAEITAVDPDASAKISEANIPRRLAIRKKVARKRLRLDGHPEEEVNQGRSVDGNIAAAPTGRRRTGGRRRIPQNRLSGAEPAKEYEGSQKGVAEESVASVDVSSSTTPAPQAPAESSPPVESNQAVLEELPQVPEMEPVIPSSTTTAPPPLQSLSFEQDEIPEAMMPAHEAPAPVENKEQDSPSDIQEPIPAAPVVPLITTTSTTTTSAPEVIPEEIKPMAPVESPAPIMMDPKHYDDYYEEYDDALPAQQEAKAINENQQAPALISQPSPSSDSGSSSSESDSAELPILEGAKKEDFPAVFGSDADNSVETDRGEIITRYKSSQPVDELGSDEAAPAPAVPAVTPSTTTTTTTTEQNIPQVEFMNNDPPEEHPPPASEELEEPLFQPLSTTEQPPIMSTTAASSQMLSTTASPASSSSEEMADSLEDEHIPEQPPSPPSSSTTESPEEKEPMIVATMPSSTESSQEDAIQPQSVEEDQKVLMPLPPSAPEMNDDSQADEFPSSSTIATPIEVSSSTTEEMPIQMEEVRDEVNPSTESSPLPSSSSTENPQEEMSIDDEKIVSSSTTITPFPSPATTEAPQESHEDFPQSNENLQDTSAEQPEESQSVEEEEKMTSDELIGKAQRLALEESLRRLRGRQQSTTEPGDDVSQDDDHQNGTVEGETKGKLKGFVRRPLQLANLTLPTTAPLTNINAVLDDGEGEHQSRHQVIEKIQRFRATYRGRTTTKRPRRVTRPSSTERLPLPDLDSYSDSSSSTSGPVEYSSTSTPSSSSSYSPIITTTRRPSRFRTYLTSTTEAITTVEPTTTTSTPAPDILTTTDYDRARTTTFPATTTPSTTTTSIDDFSENGDDKSIAYNDEDDHVYYDEGHHDSTDPSSIASSTGRSEFMYTTPSTTTTTTSTEGPFMTTTDHIEPEEFSTESVTFSTTTTDIPLATTTTAGQLIIHEILPTMPPLKEVSFVIGESVEEDQVIQSEEEHPPPPSSLEEHAVVRVETKVKVSSSVSGEDPDSSQQVSSYETSNESSPSSTPSSERTGRKIRVVIRRQRQRQARHSVNATGRRMTQEQIRRRRKVVVPRQLRRRS